MFLHFKLCRVSINPVFSLWTQICYFFTHYYCEVTFSQRVIYSKPNSASMCFAGNWRYLIMTIYLNIEYHTSLTRLMLVLRKHEVIIVTILQMHTSWQWFMIAHDNTSPLNIFGELYCKGYFSLFLLLLLYVFVWLYYLMITINTFWEIEQSNIPAIYWAVRPAVAPFTNMV